MVVGGGGRWWRGGGWGGDAFLFVIFICGGGGGRGWGIGCVVGIVSSSRRKSRSGELEIYKGARPLLIPCKKKDCRFARCDRSIKAGQLTMGVLMLIPLQLPVHSLPPLLASPLPIRGVRSTFSQHPSLTKASHLEVIDAVEFVCCWEGWRW